MGRSSALLAALFGAALMVWVVGCGSGDAETTAAGPTATVVEAAITTETEAVTPTPTSEVMATPTSVEEATPVVDVDPEEWLVLLSESLTSLRYETRWAEVDYYVASQQQFGSVAVESDRFRRLALVHEAFVAEWPAPPLPFADAAMAHRDAAVAVVDQFRVLADEWDSDARIGELSNDTPSEVWDEYYGRQDAALRALDEACFLLQGVVDDAGLGLVDCVGSGDPQVAPTAAQCEKLTIAFGEGLVEACTQGGAPGPGDDAAIAAGERVVFDEFVVPFAITTTEDSTLVELSTAVEIGPAENPWFERRFEVIWLDEIADPEAMEPGIFALGPTIPVPGDLGLWISDQPIEIVAEGTSMFGDVEARWWRTEAASDPILESDVTEFYAFTDSGISVVSTVRRDTTIWQIPHGDGDGALIVYAIAVIESPEAVSMDEKFAFVEAALTSFEFVE